MRLSVSLFGVEIISVSTEAVPEKEPGDCTSSPISFVASPGDQRWEPSAGGGEL